MARGKHAARSVNRANEAAVAHIDRLTSDLVEAKYRVRAVENAARSVPALRARITELEEQIATDTHVTAAHDAANEYWTSELKRILRATFTAIDDLEREYEGAVARIPEDDDYAFMTTCASLEQALYEVPPLNEIIGLSSPRHHRRTMGRQSNHNALQHAWDNDSVIHVLTLDRKQPWVIERMKQWEAKGTSPDAIADAYLAELAANAPRQSEGC